MKAFQVASPLQSIQKCFPLKCVYNIRSYLKIRVENAIRLKHQPIKLLKLKPLYKILPKISQKNKFIDYFISLLNELIFHDFKSNKAESDNHKFFYGSKNTEKPIL